jgi:hypothetical protein
VLLLRAAVRLLTTNCYICRPAVLYACWAIVSARGYVCWTYPMPLYSDVLISLMLLSRVVQAVLTVLILPLTNWTLCLLLTAHQ